MSVHVLTIKLLFMYVIAHEGPRIEGLPFHMKQEACTAFSLSWASLVGTLMLPSLHWVVNFKFTVKIDGSVSSSAMLGRKRVYYLHTQLKTLS